jgi:hypothetical protein
MYNVQCTVGSVLCLVCCVGVKCLVLGLYDVCGSLFSAED